MGVVIEQERPFVAAAPAPLSLAGAFLHNAFALWIGEPPPFLDLPHFVPVQS